MTLTHSNNGPQFRAPLKWGGGAKNPTIRPTLMRYGTWNVGSLTGRSGEIEDTLERRKVDVCCVQETRWKGEGARVLRTRNGKKYKLFGKGFVAGLSGTGVIVEEKLIEKVVEVVRVNERLMMMKIIVGKSLVNVVSAYAPQVGRSQSEKDEFWESVWKLIEGIKEAESIILGGDLNGHVGKNSDGFEEIHGGHGYGVRNAEGERILEFGEAASMIVCGTQFKKEESKLVSYSSGGSNTTVDYLMTRKRDRGYLRDAKGFPGEEVVSQHRLMVCDMEVNGRKTNRRQKFQPKRRVWKLRDPELRKRFEETLVTEREGGEINQAWERLRDSLLRATEETCGWTKGHARHVQTWWWNGEVKEAIEAKKEKFKEWYKAPAGLEKELKRREYNMAKKNAKRTVAKSQQAERKKFGEKLDTEEGQKSVYRIARQMAGEKVDVVGVNCLKSEDGKVLIDPSDVEKRWREYMQKLLNVENDWDGVLEADVMEGPCELISEVEVKEAIKNMKVGKAGGPSEVVGEMLKAAGKNGVSMMTDLCNQVIREGVMPKDWERSTLIPIYKGKGDPMDCGSYRAVKLLEHGMKVLERVLERRLRSKIKIDDMQFGFMPGKGTVDAIFMVRQLQEKFLEKKKDLYFAFVDLEKAFDRVPREVVRWALRKRGVEEWMVNAVMVMYKSARTAVRTKQGRGKEFEVKVGVHQGSVLSPLLFVTVMDVLTQGVREGLPWELLYADDLVLVAQSLEELSERIVRWKESMEAKGLKVNVGKTKVMRSGKGGGQIEKVGKWPCTICGKGVGVNSIQCTSCMGWVHKRCSGIRGSLVNARSFNCKICTTGGAQPQGKDMIQDLDLGNGEIFRGVRRFCYLGDMLNGEGGSNSASIIRVRCGWSKFRQLSGVLTAKNVALRLKGKVYATCVRSAMLYGSETWAVNKEQENRFERAEMRMVRWMCGVSLRERKTSAELRRRLGIVAIGDMMRRSRLRWLGHVLRKDDSDWVRQSMDMVVEGRRGRGRPRLTWEKVVESDMKLRGLTREDAEDRLKWRVKSWG